MTTIIEAGNGVTPAPEPIPNGFTPDAQERMARLRAMAAEFPDEPDPRPLTPAEIRLARQTTATALEKTAVFAEAAPGVGNPVTSAAELRDAIAFELAYSGVRDQARALARHIDLAILRRKLKAVRSARGLYRMAKGYVTLDVGEPVRPHVADMKRTFTRPRRKKLSAQTEPKTAEQK
jgi:hypothetical protein